VAGAADEAKGRTRQGVGDLVHDRDMQREGTNDQLGGTVGHADDVEDTITGKG